jgi:hypothetical protein
MATSGSVLFQTSQHLQVDSSEGHDFAMKKRAQEPRHVGFTFKIIADGLICLGFFTHPMKHSQRAII